MAIKLSDHFTYGRLVRFALPSIAMMIFTSIYSVVDGLFVSNFAGKEALAVVNLVFPLAMALGSVGFMLGTGGAALVAKTMGEGDAERANRLFSFITIAAAVAGAVLIAVGAAALEPVLLLLGAQGSLLEQGLLYGRILLVALPLFIVQNVFLSFFIAAEKPQVGFAVTVAAGVTNIVLDYLFIAVLGWGDSGRRGCDRGGPGACRRGIGRVLRAQQDEPPSLHAPGGGLPRAGGGLRQRFVGADDRGGRVGGEHAVQLPAHDAGRRRRRGGVRRDHVRELHLHGGVLRLLHGNRAGGELSLRRADPELAAMTLHGFRIYAVAFLVCGFNIYGSAFFTALNNGKVSALISFMRTLVFETSTVMLLPIVWGIDGVWSAIIVAEACALVLTTFFLVYLRKPYGYA